MQTIFLQPGDPTGIFGEEHPDIPGTHPSAITGFDAIKGVINIDPGKCIPLLAFNHAMIQHVVTDVSASARTSGRPEVTEFTCMKSADLASVKLYDYCLRAVSLGAGKNQPTMLFVIDHNDSGVTGVVRYDLRDAMISSINVHSDPERGTTEQFTLNVTELIWTRYVVDAKGVLMGTRLAGWSVMRNKPIGTFTD